MDRSTLYRKIEEKIAECGEKYEKDKDDSYLSHIRNSELETLEALYGRIRREEPSATMKADLKNRLCELEKAKKREDESPSFSWYSEHYHYLVLDGQCDAYRTVINILEETSDK